MEKEAFNLKKFREKQTKNAFQKVAAAGLARLLGHMIQQPFAIISAFTEKESIPQNSAVNNSQQAELKNFLQSNGFGFIDIRGAWDYEDDLNEVLPEQSIFIPNISRDEAVKIAQFFKQQALIVGEKGMYQIISGDGQSVYGEGNLLERFHILSPEEIESFHDQWGNKLPGYSEIQGKKFYLMDEESRRRRDEAIQNQPVAVTASALDKYYYYELDANSSFHHSVHLAIGKAGVIKLSGKITPILAQNLSVYIPLEGSNIL